MLVLLAAISSTWAQEGGPGGMKTAWVDMQELFADYHKTKKAEREINLERAKIRKRSQSRFEEVKLRRQSLMKLQAQLSSDQLSPAEKEERERLIPLMIREIDKMETQRNRILTQENTRLNDQMAGRMKALLQELVVLVQKTAEEQGYDLVLDSSGRNTSQAPPVAYVRDATDLTPVMRKILAGMAEDS